MATGKRYRAAVIGGSGYGGAELIRRLLIHPEVELVRVASVDFVGEPLSAADPALEQLTDLCFEKLAPAEAARGVDVVLLGLPHTVAATAMPELAALPRLKVVDMSGDFRLKDVAAYQRWYRHQHPCPELLADFVYGLPELNRDRLRSARLVASPGCFATTIELMLLPLARAGLLSGVVHVQGITGSSGSGVAPSAGTHHPVRAGNLKSYKPLEHQHVPEVTETLAAGRGAPTWRCASCRSRRRSPAASSPPASWSCPRPGPSRGSTRSTATPTPGSPSCGCRRGGCRRWRPSPAPTSPRWAWRPASHGAGRAR